MQFLGPGRIVTLLLNQTHTPLRSLLASRPPPGHTHDKLRPSGGPHMSVPSVITVAPWLLNLTRISRAETGVITH